MRSSSEDAAVDSMASLMVVNSVAKLYRVTDASPKLEIETADGLVPVKAVGVALAYLRVGWCQRRGTPRRRA
jgi:hypothetical protein